MKYATLGALCALAMGLSACAGVPPSDYNEELGEITGQNGRACVRSSSIRGYGVVNDKTVTISATGRKYYVATLLYSCSSLETGLQAGFESRFAELCGGTGANLFSPEERCVVRGLYEFEDREAAFKALEKAEALAKERDKPAPRKSSGQIGSRL